MTNLNASATLTKEQIELRNYLRGYQSSNSLIADLHAKEVKECVKTAKLYYQFVMYKRYGKRMQLRPGWRRPRIVDVLKWGGQWTGSGITYNGTFCLVECIETKKQYIFPIHQLMPVCWRCHGSVAVYAFKSKKAFPCPACSWREQ